MIFSIDTIIDKIICEEDLGKSFCNLKYPCNLCSKSVMKNQKAVQCDSCDLWVHIKCNGTSDDEYNGNDF